MSGELTVSYARDLRDTDVPYGHIHSATFFESAEYDQQLFDLRKDIAPIVDETFVRYAETEQDFAVNLQRAFRASFKLSTGSPFLQLLLQARTAQIISMYHVEPDTLASLATNLTLDADYLAVPAHHAHSNKPQRLLKRSEALWELFMDVCKNPNDLDLVQPKDTVTQSIIDDASTLGTFNFAPFTITNVLLHRELAYLEGNGRPNRSDIQSRFRSLIRECGIIGKPTGSSEFDVIMKEVGAVLGVLSVAEEATIPDLWVFREIKPKFERLKSVWENHHQQSF